MGIFDNDKPVEDVAPEPDDDAADVFLDEEEAKPTPEPPKPDPVLTPRPANTIVLTKGDTPFTVARELYGNGNRGRELVKKNAGVKWKPGVVIKLL